MFSLRNITLTATIGIACASQAVSPVIRPDKEIERKIEKTLGRMTLEEKIGQMTELSIDVLGEWKDGEFRLDRDKLHNAIAKFKVGSVLNAPGPIAQTPEKWQEIIGLIQEGNRHSVHLRTRPEPRNDLHARRDAVSAEHQHRGFVQSAAGIRRRQSDRLRDQGCQLPVDIFAHRRHGERPPVAASMGELR